MTKIAIPHWQGRISPVFDVAANVWIVDLHNGAERDRREMTFTTEALSERAARLATGGVQILICGAISWPLEFAVRTAGIEVISRRCGNVECVLAAFISGELSADGFLMPGCCGQPQRRRMCRRRGRTKE